MQPPPGAHGAPPGAKFSPRAVPGVRIMPPPSPPAAGEVLLGYYVLEKTGGCFQCADLKFCGCFWCTFFAFWLMTWPISCLICVIDDCHTGLQFPVYGQPPGGYSPQSWTPNGPPQGYQYPPNFAPPPPANFGLPTGAMPQQISGKNLQQQEQPPMGYPMTTQPPASQDMVTNDAAGKV